MSQPATLRIVTELTFALNDDLRPYQVVELLDASSCRVALYSRYLDPDGLHWVRHGVFQAFYPSGALKSEGAYWHGKEQGSWRDHHENGVVAAEGSYHNGAHVGTWLYRHPDGHTEEPDHFPPPPPLTSNE
jgi:hypothetical protein